MDKNIINDNLTNVINDLGTSIDSYFKANFDEELALDKVKQNILLINIKDFYLIIILVVDYI